MTDAEKRLWRHLRNRQFAGLKFVRQMPVGPYFPDFLCRELKLIIEVDGGQHSMESDAARTAFLESQGYRVLRFWNNDVLARTEAVLETLLVAVEELAPPAPSPAPALPCRPLPKGEK